MFNAWKKQRQVLVDYTESTLYRGGRGSGCGGSRDGGRDGGRGRSRGHRDRGSGRGGGAATAAVPWLPPGWRWLKKNRPFWPFEKKIDVLDRFAPFRKVFYLFSTVLDQIIPPFWVV